MTWVIGLLAISISCLLLYIAGNILVSGLIRLSRYFHITEFMTAFFVMAFASSLPNLFVGVTSALQGIPELSFGDIMGNNLLVLTVAIALSVLFAPSRQIPIEQGTVRDTAFFTAVAALLPIILISDGLMSRSDGLILILCFIGYGYWLWSRSSKFSKVYLEHKVELSRTDIVKDVVKVIVGVVIMAISAQGIVYGASLFGQTLGLPLVVIGMLITSLGGALPEIFFAVISAYRNESGLIIGSLMGAVVVPVTLVLGLVAVLHPISNENLAFPLINRIFLVIIACFFLYVSQMKQFITWREGVALLALYIAFLVSLFLL